MASFRERRFKAPLPGGRSRFKYHNLGRVLPEGGSRDQLDALEEDLTALSDTLRVAVEMGCSDEYLADEMRQIVSMADALIDKRQRDELSNVKKFVSIVIGSEIADYKLKNEFKQTRTKIREVISKWEASRFRYNAPIARIPSEAAVDLEYGVDKSDIESRLTDISSEAGKGRSMISIVGVGGAGKTTLARRIFNNSVIANHFPARAWVTVPWLFSVEEVFRSVAEQVKEEFERTEWDWKAKNLIHNLRDFLATRRYLIVLDDVRTTITWDALEAAFPDKSNGSRILITTRINDVAAHASPSTSRFELRSLSDEEGWDVLKSKVRVPDGLEEVGKEIVRRCMGFPRLISIAGALLSGGDHESSKHWSSVLNWLKQDQESLYQDLNKTGNLLPLYLKRCLYYFALLPAGYRYRIRASRLTRKQGNQEPPESIAEEYLTKLIEHNMIAVVERNPDGRVKTCRIQDGLREFWVEKARKSKFSMINYIEAINSNASSSDLYDKKDVSYSNILGSNRDNVFFFFVHSKQIAADYCLTWLSTIWHRSFDQSRK